MLDSDIVAHSFSFLACTAFARNTAIAPITHHPETAQAGAVSSSVSDAQPDPLHRHSSQSDQHAEGDTRIRINKCVLRRFSHDAFADYQQISGGQGWTPVSWVDGSSSSG